MGQAQLVLLALGVLLVGIAILSGIQIYDQTNRKSSVDLLTHEAIAIAADLQLWVQKPAQLQGKGSDATLPETASPMAKATLEKLGHKKAVDTADQNCKLSDLTNTSALITCANSALGTEVVVSVSGLTQRDITLVSTKLR